MSVRRRLIPALLGLALVLAAPGTGRTQATCGDPRTACPRPTPVAAAAVTGESPGADGAASEKPASEGSPSAGAPPLRPATPAPNEESGGIVDTLTGLVRLVTDLPETVWNWLLGFAARATRSIFDLVGRLLFTTPQLGGHPRILQLWAVALALTDASLIVIVLVQAHLLTWGGLWQRVASKDVLERLVLGAAGAHLSLLVLTPITAFSNELSRAFLRVGADALTIHVESLLTRGINPLDLILVLVALVMAVLVPFWSLVRIVVLALLAVFGPIANITLALPEADQVARSWWRAVLLLHAVPVAQAAVYTLGFWLFFSEAPLLDLVGATFDSLVLIVFLFVLYKIPVAALRRVASPAYNAYAAVRRTARYAATAALIGRMPGVSGALLRGAPARRAGVGVGR